MTTNQRQGENRSDDDDDDDPEDEVDGSHNNTNTSDRSRESSSRNMPSTTAPHAAGPPSTISTPAATGTMNMSSSCNDSVASSISTITPYPHPPILRSVEGVESAGSRPGAYAVAPGNRITPLAATSKALFHHSHHNPSLTVSTSSSSLENEHRTLSTEEIIAMLQSTRTYTDEEVMAPTLLRPPTPPQLLSTTSSMTISTDNADTSRPLYDQVSGRNDADHTTLSPHHAGRSSSDPESAASIPVPVAHLVPIAEEPDGTTTTHTPMMTIMGTPYIEAPPRDPAQPRDEPPQERYKTIQQHLQRHKVYYILLTLVASLAVSAGIFGLICGVAGSCSNGTPERTSGTDPPVIDPRSIDFMNYINNITLTNRTIGYPPPPRSTTSGGDVKVPPAEELALQWIIDVDPLRLWANRTEHQFQIRQRYALRTLYAAAATKRVAWTNASGWLSPPPSSSTYDENYDECRWFGVNCTMVSGMSNDKNVVTSLTLSNNGLYGPLSPDLGLLSDLTVVDLSLNNFCGPLPATIGQWQALAHLDLSGTSDFIRTCLLNGTLPATIGQWNGPTTIDFSGQALSGLLPASMSNWNADRMQKFRINYNSISGTIPAFVATWWNVTHMEMLYNELTGTIPEMIGNMRQLQKIAFAGNKLNGTLPASIENLTRITTFSMSENRLSGTLPEGILSRWTNLQFAGLAQNNFANVTVPEGICLNNRGTSTFLWVQVEIDCNRAAAEDVCSCCLCVYRI